MIEIGHIILSVIVIRPGFFSCFRFVGSKRDIVRRV